MTSENKITIYEVDGKEYGVTRPDLLIKNHWNQKELVVIQLEDKSITVSADDLKKAIANAQNCHRY